MSPSPHFTPDAFLERSLCLDLETDGHQKILKIGAVLGKERLELLSADGLGRALAALTRLARGAERVLGHNLLGHDLDVLRRVAPGHALHALPVVDTLFLSPLAFPENPYHHLVKDYKLVRSSLNDPVADARLAARVFRDQWRSFAETAERDPGLLAFYAFCLRYHHDHGGLAGVFHAVSGDAAMSRDGAVAWLVDTFADVVCRRQLRELAASELGKPAKRPPWAYAVAWLGVAGGNSVLPPWVRHRYPETVQILRTLRDLPCGDAGCPWCAKTHDAQEQLQRFFGFESFRPVPTADDGTSLQERIVRHGLQEKPHLAILATGAGKSICYQLPALVRYLRRGLLTVVISPLQALMKDQVDNLNAQTGSDAAAALYGLLTPPERGVVLERTRLGDVAILYVAPEQLRNASFRRVLEQREVGAWVFDEAHCLSKWGHDFRPDYLYAARFIAELARRQGTPVPPVMAFTATAKRDVKDEVVEHFRDHLGLKLRVFESGVERDELRFRVERVNPAAKLERIAELVEEKLSEGGSAVVYFATRRRTEEGAEYLKKKGLDVAAFHAGLKTPEKRDVLDAFVEGSTPVVCATNAFGMGIDKDDVHLVVHADVPGSLESYLQEAGRAGRDRLPSDCVLLFDDDDVETQFKLAASSRLERRDIAAILRGLRRARRGETGEVVITSGELLRDEEVDADIDVGSPQADTKVKTAVAWLERAGFVERDANLTKVFQGKVRCKSLDEAKERLDRLRLSESQRRRWLAILKALLNSPPDQGLSADEIAELPGVRWGPMPPDAPETPAQKVLRTLHEMADAGFLSSGLLLTAYLKPRGPSNAAAVYERLCALERAMLDLLAESEPDADDGSWFELSLKPLNQRLLDGGHKTHPETLRRLVRSLSEDGKGLAGRRGSLELAYRSRDRFRVRLCRPWPLLKEVSQRRQAIGKVVLETLIAKTPPKTEAKVLVELGSEELTEALRRDLVLRGQVRKPLAAVERALLFLHEQKVIQLQQGLAVFRQAMTLKVEDQPHRRYTLGDYAPLAQHYDERTFQIHVMSRYAKLGLEKLRSALRLVSDYFELSRTRFVESWFAGEKETIARATSRESFKRIVDDLKDPSQVRLVAAPPDKNLLILAGPGSGKTRVVVHRAAYLLRVVRVPARSLLVLCYNRNAALEVRRRLFALVGDDARGVTVQTYHGLAMRLTGTSFAPWGDAAATSYREPDFDRLIPDAVKLLRSGTEDLPGLEADELRERLLQGYSHVLVDEYQDINGEQYELVSAIAGRSESDGDRKLSILAVGDDDQAIYGWSGASVEYIHRFRGDYQAEVHTLTQCYRSTARILAASNEVIGRLGGRMKTDHLITVDAARRGDPPGTPVVVDVVADAAHQAAALVDALEDLRRRDPDLAWTDCAVLARRHAVLEPIRSLLEARGVPVSWTPERDLLPPLGRIREVARLVRALAERRHELRRASELLDLQKKLAGGSGDNPWNLLAEEVLGEWRDETHDAETSVQTAIEHVYEALAERRREPSFGRGVRLLTAHAAKGLEFRHVFVPGGFWTLDDEERRLYYVAMTRARESLRLFERRDETSPFTPALSSVERREPRVERPPAEVLERRYGLWGLSDVYLSFAGRRPADDGIHRRLAALEPGSKLVARRIQGGQVYLVDADDELVGALAEKTARTWWERLDSIESLRVLAMVERRAEDSEEPYRSQLLVERWEVPLVEVVYRREAGLI